MNKPHNGQYSAVSHAADFSSFSRTFHADHFAITNSLPPFLSAEAKTALRYSSVDSVLGNNETLIVEEQLNSPSAGHAASILPIDLTEPASDNRPPSEPSQKVMQPMVQEMAPRKRKKAPIEKDHVKKRKTGEVTKPKRVLKPKVEKGSVRAINNCSFRHLANFQ
jgi:hypothetical protein